ncbi:PREDICTED: serine/threonine-protein kinase pelle [Ceratosolen solmsi marchali]|uniref:non-specific serine/threonine protein kinase n=1 Tax=Ceratosolen solmsi marchali TaxID=326594 RepID=A0AAJ6YBQ4_9HYME|nr:PREDICTED: serine/threonine-protein kinase pelle [Ceratosolen solmsi marchali]
MEPALDIYQYIYDLPLIERRQLCKALNEDNKWEKLAAEMSYDSYEIGKLRNKEDPTDQLFTMWGEYNHSLSELFVILSRIRYYQLMTILKPFVHSRYHVLLNNVKDNYNKIVQNEKQTKDTKDLKIGVQNFNHNQKPDENTIKVIVNQNTKEDSIKILNQPIQQQQQNETPSNSDNLLISIPTIFKTLLPRISYDELTAATDNWNKENILGKGGFGTVYKGIWKNTEVAIKKLEPRGSDYDESYTLQIAQSFREIRILNSLPHENILPLYAYSAGSKAPCLIYQCMKNGSLEDRLHLKHGYPALNWLQRQVIAKGTARGLQYLHTIHEKPLIHGDIKSANILLDRNFEPKIGDFGLAKEGSSNDFLKVSKIQGTRPYLPEEYIFGRCLSTKIDTYSYGIVLFELATGLSAYDKSRPTNKRLKEYIDNFDDSDLHLLKDKRAGEKYEEAYKYLMSLGKWCSNKLAAHRPEMSVVYEKFEN